MLSVRESVVLRGDTVTIPVAMRHAEREEGARMHIQGKTSDRGPRPAGFTAQPTGLSIDFGRFRGDFGTILGCPFLTLVGCLLDLG